MHIERLAGSGVTRRLVSPLRIRADARTLLAVMMLLIFLILIFRNAGLYPNVFLDEWIFSRAARHADFSEASIPIYLYYLIFRMTSYCGDGFAACARLLNALFFVAALPFIFLTARRVTSERIATLIATVAAIGPINTYTAYFMPEAIHFFCFWAYTWYLLGFRGLAPSRFGFLAGALFGAMMLIKVHTIFMLPAVIVVIVQSSIELEARFATRRAATNIVCFVIAAMATRLLLGYLLAGNSGLDVLGHSYGGHATATAGNTDYSRLALQTIWSLKNHLLGLSLMFGVPVAILLCWPQRDALRPEVASSLSCLHAYTLPLLGCLLFVTAAFTASVVAAHPFERLENMYARYYSFAFPLLFMVAAAQITGKSVATCNGWRIAVLVLIAGLAIYAWLSIASLTRANAVSAPELWGFTANRSVFGFLGAFGLVTLLTWGVSRRWGAIVFSFAYLPLSTVIAGAMVNLELRYDNYLNVFDRAGVFVRQNLAVKERSRVAIVSADPYGYGTSRTLFHIDQAEARVIKLPESVRLEAAQVPAGTQWLLMIGDHGVPTGFEHRLQMNGFSLIKAPGAMLIDFSLEPMPAVIARMSGLAAPSSLGMWSTGNLVRLDFAAPLPARFELRLKGRAHGASIGMPLVIRVGDQAREFRLRPAVGSISLEFRNSHATNAVSIEIPSPALPAESGNAGGGRRFGVQIVEIDIRPMKE